MGSIIPLDSTRLSRGFEAASCYHLVLSSRIIDPMNGLTVDVVIPAKNAAAEILATLDSLAEGRAAGLIGRAFRRPLLTQVGGTATRLRQWWKQALFRGNDSRSSWAPWCSSWPKG